MGRLLLALFLVTAAPGVALAGAPEAREAYDRGDDAGALAACKSEAERGDASCQNFLGVLYAQGRGIPRDEAAAARWFRKAAEQGHGIACVNLGEAYEKGHGVKQSNDEAAQWYAKAAAQHVAQGELALGLLIARVDKNYREAVKWFRRAARQGLPSAEAALALSYQAGTGLKRNDRLAAKWFLLSADGGFGLAQAAVGRLYEKGVGLEQDSEEAYFWYKVASVNPTTPEAQKAEIRTALARLGKSLSAAQIADAEDAIKSFHPDRQAPSTAPGRSRRGQGGTPGAESGPRLIGTGSGFVVTTAGHIISNHHVTASCGEMRVTEGERSETVKVLATDSARDLALLQMPHAAPVTAVFRDASPVKLGEGVVVMGFPLSGLITSEAVVTTGIVSALAGIHNDPHLLQISAPVQPGNSGGPLLDTSGHLVGVVVSKLDGLKIAQLTGAIPENVNFAIKGQEAKAFLAEHHIELATAASDKELSTAAIADQALKFTVRLECWK